MRLPLAIPLDARDGLTDQDGRMTNVVAEVYEDKTFVTSRPALNELTSLSGASSGVVCFGGELISVAGSSAYTITSTDGDVWATQTPAETNAWRSVAYGGGIFVAVSSTGTNRVMTSTDGVTWTPRAAAAANTWLSVTYGNGLFVAVASTGTNRVMTSPDGIIWTSQSCPSVSWESVTYGANIFVAASSNSVTPLMSSPDGVTWTARTFNDGGLGNTFSKVAFGNDVFVGTNSGSSGHLIYSSDGINWTFVSGGTGIAISWDFVFFRNDKFFQFDSGSGRCITSSDGITWTEITIPSGSWSCIGYGDGVYVALSLAGAIITSSDNGDTWTLSANTVSGLWREIQFGNGVFVAISLTSPYVAITSIVQSETIDTVSAGQYDFAQSTQ